MVRGKGTMGDTARDDYTVGNEHDNGPRQPNFLQKRMLSLL